MYTAWFIRTKAFQEVEPSILKFVFRETKYKMDAKMWPG